MKSDANCILILHLSDFHFRSASFGGQPGQHRAEKVVAAVQARSEFSVGLGMCCVVLSGDIAQSGTSAEYEKATEFIRHLANEIRTRLQLEPHFLAVPGNHDCDFNIQTSVRDPLVSNVDASSVDITYVNS